MSMLAALFSASGRGFEITRVEAPPELTALPMHIGGRVVAVATNVAHPIYRLQWPGVYFEAVFEGSVIYLRTGDGRAIFHVLVDNQPAFPWLNPGAGVYAIRGLSGGKHAIRVELATECQGGAVDFAGFATSGARPESVSTARPRQIEFIGDSHTVGYGDTSTKRLCTPEDVWSTTDTSQSFGVLVAKHYDADYEINAISGRGVVRNYGGGGGDPLPVVYPYALFDKQQRVEDRTWNPQVVVVALGTNDFSTPLHAGEKWRTRDDLRADFEQSYVRFVAQVRHAHPRAFFILAANDSANGEIQSEVLKVIARLAEQGEKRVGFVPFNDLELTACDWHPSIADHWKMAGIVMQFIDAHPDLWPKR